MDQLKNMVHTISANSRKRFSSKYTSLSGAVISKKNNSQVWFESSPEKDFALIMEFNPEVSHYIEQPFRIEYIYDGKDRSYTPDFLVFYNDGRPNELCEIKSKQLLIQNEEKLTIKFEAAKEFCVEENILFKIFTEEQIRSPYLENIKFLSQYEMHFASQACINLVRSRVADFGKTSPNELFTSFQDANFQIRGKLIYAFWVLLKLGDIECDLNEKITLKSEIWLNEK